MKSPGPLLQTIDGEARAGARTVLIGDIHGCYEELISLLDCLHLRRRDLVVSLGDIVRKGPEVEKCLELWGERGYLAVRGNNEATLLRAADGGLATRMLLARRDRGLLQRGDLMDMIRNWPLAIDFPGQGVTAVHGGILPGTEISEQAIGAHPRAALSLRWVRYEGDSWRMVRKSERRTGDRRWSEVWEGPRMVVYGHTTVKEPRRDPKALGIDTGCVYGGKLTAAVLEDGVWSTVSVPALRRYAPRGGMAKRRRRVTDIFVE